MKTKIPTFKQPKLGLSFSCTGDKCQMTCCKGWTVALNKQSFDLYRNTPAIKDNVQKIRKDRHRTKDRFGEMKLRPDGACSMLDEAGLCEVYKQLGETALSKTCNTFPRDIIKSKNNYKLSFSTACPEVVRLLCTDPDSMKQVHSAEGLNRRLQYYVRDTNSDLLDERLGFNAIYDFFENSNLPLWKKVIVLIFLFRSVNLANHSSYDLIMSTLLEKQLYLEKTNSESAEELFQYETFSEVVFADEVLENMNPQIHQYIVRSRTYMGVNSDSFNDQAKRYMIRKSMFLPLSGFSNDKMWTNLYLNFLDKNGPLLFNTTHFTDIVAHTTIQHGIIKFLAITGLKPEDPNALEWFYHLVPSVVRSLDHNEGMRNKIFNNLAKKYPTQEERAAMLGLLIK